MSEVGLWFFLCSTFPIVIWCAWSDLKNMIIPNKANIVLFAIFVIFGAFFMPLPEFGIRILQAIGVLVLFFVLNSMGLIGGGDAKLFAAIAPYVAYRDVTIYLFLLSFLSISAVVLHRVIDRTTLKNTVFSNWKSWSEKIKFPFGLPLAGSLSAYLIYSAMQ
ncbi:membrane protein [Amylibacter ulvae]|uniref:Membrane protein n=1 Tax=Paramylibacter ulvae TaxID=1651968 RepID=A0ABQ3CZ22_9RHOB|nr:prepilin peptidase [Amylibacter ulvae]GHA50718.1 membrane protein [Amylibacter ulvae]